MVSCPPHHWLIDREAIDNVCLARCKKCSEKNTYLASIERNSHNVNAIPVSNNTSIRLRPGKKTEVKRRNRRSRSDDRKELFAMIRDADIASDA
jgi:hypothetical protein